MRVSIIPCLSDNYAYLVEGDEPGVCAVIDPSEAGPVQKAVEERKLRVGAILATHHHFDHVGGIGELIGAFPDAVVVGYRGDQTRIEGLTRLVDDGEELRIAGLSLRVRHIPGHTLGAVAYVVEEGGAPAAVFTGDTLFVAGCGRLFEGTPADMHRSLVEVLGALPDGVQVYCGHEYTQGNLRFAAHVEPDNKAVTAAAAHADELRSRGLPTVPSTLGEERRINPFLRVNEPAVRAFASASPGASGAEVLGAIRVAKDSFGIGAKAGAPR
jgi:hydroxyacylglutathione hydrolase